MIVSPPLVSEHAHIDELIEKAWRSLDMTAATLASGTMAEIIAADLFD
jgi:hypothetical protein